MTFNTLIWACATIFLVGCFRDDKVIIVKPKGYPRIILPEKKYIPLETEVCPFTFLRPEYSYSMPYREPSKKCWFNLKFPQFKATIFFTYDNPGKNIQQYIDDTRTLAYKHITRANAIREQEVADSPQRVFGIIYFIEGDVASSCQFYLTDSLRHFLRGSFYFDIQTEPDSVAPVREFLIQDIHMIVKTLNWKNL